MASEKKPSLENVAAALRKWQQKGDRPGELWSFIDEAAEKDQARQVFQGFVTFTKTRLWG